MVVCSTSSCSSMSFHYSLIPDLSGFSSLLSPAHMLPFRVPSTPTQPQGVTLTDCYHAGYSCWGLSRLLRLEVLWSRDCHHSVPHKAQQEEPSFVQSSGTNIISMSICLHSPTRTPGLRAFVTLKMYSYIHEISTHQGP